jgi:hypothetical protein
MKILYHEIMFSIIDGVPYARLFDYFHNEKGEPQKIIWYRDAAYAGLFLEFIGRTDLIEKFTANIHEMYDQNRDVKEPDNLGQILYLQSLTKNKNNDLIKAIIEEAGRIKDSDGNLRGTTDGSRSSAYQNGWLIFGLERLGMREDAARFNRHSQIDDNGYSRLLWFTLPQSGVNRRTAWRDGDLTPIKISAKSRYTNVDNQPYPYINIGKDHFAMRAGTDYNNPILTQIVYPITWGDGTRPHIWHSVELFMYCAEFQNP